LTDSPDFPLENAYQDSYGGTQDAFVTKLNSTGTSLLYSTYLGGNDYDGAYSIAVDTAGNAYVMGNTQSTDFPLENAYQDKFGGHDDLFVAKFTSSGNSLAYSTYIGGSCYVTGATISPDFPLENAYQDSCGGEYSAFVTKLNSTGDSLSYSTYLGGSSCDYGKDIAVDSM